MVVCVPLSVRTKKSPTTERIYVPIHAYDYEQLILITYHIISCVWLWTVNRRNKSYHVYDKQLILITCCTMCMIKANNRVNMSYHVYDNEQLILITYHIISCVWLWTVNRRNKSYHAYDKQLILITCCTMCMIKANNRVNMSYHVYDNEQTIVITCQTKCMMMNKWKSDPNKLNSRIIRDSPVRLSRCTCISYFV